MSLLTGTKPIKSKDDALHGMTSKQVAVKFPVFNSYLEVAIGRQKKVSYTETIEEAMLQVVRGQSGLMTKLISFQQDFQTTAIPVVVTTGQLLAAHFDTERVALNTGTLSASDLRLERLEFCAINFHPNDRLKTASEFSRDVENVEHDMRFSKRAPCSSFKPRRFSSSWIGRTLTLRLVSS